MDEKFHKSLTAGLVIVVFFPSIWIQTFAAISRSLDDSKKTFNLFLQSKAFDFAGSATNDNITYKRKYFPHLLLRGRTLTATLTEAILNRPISLPLSHFWGFHRQIKAYNDKLIFLNHSKISYHSRACAHRPLIRFGLETSSEVTAFYKGGGGALGGEWGKKGGWFSFTLLPVFFFCWRQCGHKIDTSQQKYLDPPENLETLKTWRWKFRNVSSFFVDKAGNEQQEAREGTRLL